MQDMMSFNSCRALRLACRVLARPLLLGLALILVPAGPAASQGRGPDALQARYTSLAPQLASNPYGGPLYLESAESSRQIEGDVYAVVDYPFATLSAALADPQHWCDVLILHLNTKLCRRSGEGPDTRLLLRIGKKYDQPLIEAAPVTFSFRAVTVAPGYLDLELSAPDGPFDTRDYRILFEAIPSGPQRSFLHMRYAFGYGTVSHMAMHVYLATIGRNKVGFTLAAPARPGEAPAYIGGMRALVERNTMRYYLAIDAYLGALSAPPQQQLEKRLESWFVATERYPRQLREIDRATYLDMKRSEYRRQQAPL